MMDIPLSEIQSESKIIKAALCLKSSKNLKEAVTMVGGQYRELCGCDIVVGRGLLKTLSPLIERHHQGSRVFLVSDEQVFKHHGREVLETLLKNFRVKCHLIEPGEKSKSLKSAELLYDFLTLHHARRDDLIIAVGGGVVGDLAGYVASTYLRGMNFVQVPTSLMAQVDSSIGGKVGVNGSGGHGKNLIGSFHHPKMVVIDHDLLKTLPVKEVKNGMGEVVKYGFMADATIVESILQMEEEEDILDRDDILMRCVEAKIAIVARDEREAGERKLLNFGHTLGHVIEAAGHYHEFSHGEAVAVGMALMTEYSVGKKITEKKAYTMLIEVLDKLGIRSTVNRMELKLALGHLKLDKKNTAQGLSVVLMEQVGKCRVENIPVGEMENLLGGLS